MASWYADVPEGVDFAWCPQGCGRTTEDPYGGPCKACWRALDDKKCLHIRCEPYPTCQIED